METIQENKKLKQELTSNLLKKERIWEIDFLRSIPIIIVVLYHACFDVYLLKSMMINLSDFAINHPNANNFFLFCENLFFDPLILSVFVPMFGGIFLFICGVSSSLSSNNLKRGLLLDLAAIVFSIATYVASIILKSDDFIFFGILHQMGFSITIYALIEMFVRKVMKKKDVSFITPLIIGIIFTTIGTMYIVGFKINNHLNKWPIEYINDSYKFNDVLKNDPYAYLKIILGMKGSINDWWPILPYTGIIYIGIAVGKLLYAKNKKSLVPKLYFKGLKPLCFLGRHTIWVYLIHQPVIIIVLFIILSCMGGKFF